MSKRVDDVPLRDMLAYAQQTRQRMLGVDWYAATDGVASLIPALERILAPR
jgi:hypothetical protein